MVMHTMPRVAKVILDRAQEITAHATGLNRVVYFNSSPNDANQYGQKFTNMHDFIAQKAEAAAAEIAVASYFNVIDFTPRIENTYEYADVGLNIQVKHTKNGTHMILQRGLESRPNDVCILVTGSNPYLLLGWMPVHMAMVPKYKHPYQDNYWVPRANLFEMQYLKRSNYGDI